MRTHIDYGIYLGTDFCQLARMEHGIPVIIKTDKMKDSMPLCVHFNKKQNVLVGDTAYHMMKNDILRGTPKNSFSEFTRTLGTTHLYESVNANRGFTSEELLAECLKKVKSFIRDEEFQSVLITVPTRFVRQQKEATIQAAKLAGFNHIELLQEPIAAATAYGLTAKNKDSYWLVFDYGDGKFDTAIVKSEEGFLNIKDTDGDNWLGGKNLDEAIVDKIIIPYLKNNYAIDDLLQDTVKREILRNTIKRLAEEAKVQMSFKDTYNILTELGDLPFEDENGKEPEIDITVTQKEIENVLAPVFQKAIDIAKGLLKRNNLKGTDLGALILVGGATYSPILRRMLKEQITENIPTDVDPMTVVAIGAALFASTISVSDEVIDVGREKTKLQIDIKYEATSLETDEIISLKILRNKTEGIIPEKVFADVVRGDGAWSSGKKQIDEKAVLIDVLLQKGCSNVFTVNVCDDQGNKFECQPNQFNILQGIGGLESIIVLPYYIGIGKWFNEYEKELFVPIKGLEKNKKLPTIGTIDLKTPYLIRPGKTKDIIRIPIYQGDYNSEGTPVELNNNICDIIISGDSLPTLLLEGSPINITIKVDKSEQMQFIAYFPDIDYTEELKIQIKQYIPISSKLIDDLKSVFINFCAEHPNVGKEKFRFLLKELTRIDNDYVSQDEKLKVVAIIKKEMLLLWK